MGGRYTMRLAMRREQPRYRQGVLSIDFGAALRMSREADPASVTEIVGRAAAGLHATDVVVYLIDFGQTVLEPLPDRSARSEERRVGKECA